MDGAGPHSLNMAEGGGADLVLSPEDPKRPALREDDPKSVKEVLDYEASKQKRARAEHKQNFASIMEKLNAIQASSQDTSSGSGKTDPKQLKKSDSVKGGTKGKRKGKKSKPETLVISDATSEETEEETETEDGTAASRTKAKKKKSYAYTAKYGVEVQQFIYLHSELFTLAAQQIYNFTFFLLRLKPNQTKNQNI